MQFMPTVAVRPKIARPRRAVRKVAAPKPRKSAPRKDEFPDLIAETIRIARSVGGIKLNIPPREKYADDDYNPIGPDGKFQPPPRRTVPSSD